MVNIEDSSAVARRTPAML